jgi:hypothetical protein
MMILAIALLAAFLIATSVVLGLMFGGSKLLARRLGWAASEDAFTSLHLEGK